MIDLHKIETEFLARRKAFNEELLLNQGGKRKVVEWDGTVVIEECKPFRLKEQPLNENPQLLFVSYNNGRGAMVIDQEELMKLPAATRNKIFNIGSK